jgi:putative Holliday junction resolvase
VSDTVPTRDGLPTEGRVLGVDLGSVRIGIASCDAGRVLASPLTVLPRTKDLPGDRRVLARLVEDEEAVLVVVGLPLSLDGSTGPAAAGALAEVAELSAALPVPVTTYDERLTTVTAERLLDEQGVRGPARRKVVDMVAAAVMLQAWLDGPGRATPDDDQEHT